MNRKYIPKSLFALFLAGAALSAFAANNDDGLLGDAARPSDATRTIVINPDTAYVNITKGDIVKFVAGGKTLVWNFDQPSTITNLDLNKIAPAGFLDHSVKVYIKKDPISDGA